MERGKDNGCLRDYGKSGNGGFSHAHCDRLLQSRIGPVDKFAG